jgi:hypothetical protein
MAPEATMPFDPENEQRSVKRLRVDEPATIEHADRAEECLVRDISTKGVQLVLERPPAPDAQIRVRLPPVGSLIAKVKWRNHNRLGALLEEISPEEAERIRKI